MAINWNNPEQSTAFSFVCSFFVFTLFIYMWKPKCICTEVKGAYVISKRLLVSLSLTLALLTSLIVFLLRIRKSGGDDVVSTYSKA